MTQIVSRPLPNGRIPYEHMANADLKRAVMLLNDNIVSLKEQLEAAQRAITELQRRK